MTAKQSGTTQRFTLDPNNLPTLTPEEAAALDSAAIDYSDIPELPDSFWDSPQPKESVTIRLDRDVLDFFRTPASRGYQTRINAVLRSFVETSRKRRTPRTGERVTIEVLELGAKSNTPAGMAPAKKKAEA